ncbi:MAG: hypothetical protein GXP49_16125 [Deltaproteobacteria bacterium]|nr:hypothetical protein [Deltaproteobacteria bacterium]
MRNQYAPSLAVKAITLLRRERRLPLKGDVLCQPGDRVMPNQVIARARLPGRIIPFSISRSLGVAPSRLAEYLLKKKGDKVDAGEVIAKRSSFLKVFSAQAVSPAKGTLLSVSPLTGQALIQAPFKPVEVMAFLRGTVIEVIPERGALIEGYAGLVQGAFGLGKETYGELLPIVDSPEQVLNETPGIDDIRAKVVMAGAMVSKNVFIDLIEAGASAVITGGFRFGDAMDLGKEINAKDRKSAGGFQGVLVVTEGFGRIEMARKTFELLCESAGRMVSVSGITQVRAGVVRPEILIHRDVTMDPPRATDLNETIGFLEPGRMVRVISGKRFGKTGKLVSLPKDPQRIETGAFVRAAKIEFDNGREELVPRANLELE